MPDPKSKDSESMLSKKVIPLEDILATVVIIVVLDGLFAIVLNSLR